MLEVNYLKVDSENINQLSQCEIDGCMGIVDNPLLVVLQVASGVNTDSNSISRSYV